MWVILHCNLKILLNLKTPLTMNAKITLTILLISLCVKNSSGQQTLIVETGLDPKMLATGPYSNSEHGELDYILKIGYKLNRYEVGIFTERFEAIKFYTSGIYTSAAIYRRHINNSQVTLSCGVDAGILSRPDLNSNSFTYSLNSGLMFRINEKISIKYTANFRQRSDLVKIYNEKKAFKFAGYISLIFGIAFS